MESTHFAEYVRSLPVVSSHCHHALPEIHAGLDLTKLFSSSYVGWCALAPGEDHQDHDRYVDLLGANTYFVWLARSVDALYGEGPVCAANWDRISAAMRRAHAAPDYHFRLLSDRCRYRFAVQDCYWASGYDLGRPDLFHPAYRINFWAMSPRPGAADHGGNTPWLDKAFAPATLDDYLDAMEAAIEAGVRDGSVAIKSALAYDRPVAFDNPDRDAARRAFRGGSAKLDRADLLAFGDVVFHRVCRIAERLGVPVQVHLGLAQISGSNPMLFEPIIAAYPKVTFDLFHCGYPWLGEIAGLLHNYANVVADFCWVPLISTNAAERALAEYLDVAQCADRIVWGDDTWTGEEAYGALLAWEHVVSRVLARRVSDGLCSVAYAERLAERLMYENAEALFARG